MDQARLDDAVQLIYDVALDGARWPMLLERLAGLFNSHFADSFQRADDYGWYEGVSFGLGQEDYQEVFLGIWVPRNVWGARRPVRRAGEVVTTRDMIAADELVRTEMYNDYLAPRGLHEGLRLDIWAGGGWIEDISLLRTWSAGPFTATELRAARMLVPHLTRSAAMAHRLRRADDLASVGMITLDQLPTPTLIVGGDGAILHLNAAASRLLAEADGLSEQRGRLVAATPSLTAELEAVLAAAVAGRGVRGVGGEASLGRPSGRPALRATVLPLGGDAGRRGAGRPGSGHALLCVTDPRGEDEDGAGELGERFGLTRAELALAADLLDGQEIRDIAERRGRSVNTLRTHLARLMAKTDTRRQAELVAILARARAETRRGNGAG